MILCSSLYRLQHNISVIKIDKHIITYEIIFLVLSIQLMIRYRIILTKRVYNFQLIYIITKIYLNIKYMDFLFLCF